jgi:hypothetical protein
VLGDPSVGGSTKPKSREYAQNVVNPSGVTVPVQRVARGSQAYGYTMPVEQLLILILGAFAVTVVITLASEAWVYPQHTPSHLRPLSAAQAAVAGAEGWLCRCQSVGIDEPDKAVDPK